MTARFWLIANPIHRASRRRVAEIRVLLHQHGIACTVEWTSAVREGREQAACAVRAGAHRIIVIGGDGTVGSVVAGLDGVQIPVLIVPVGTANLAARALGLRRGPVHAGVLLSPRTRAIDVGAAEIRTARGEVLEKLFLAAAGIGNDARTIMRLGHRRKRLLGALAYPVAGIRLLRAPHHGVTVEHDGHQSGGAVWSVLVGAVRALLPGVRVFPKEGRGPDGLQLLECRARTVRDWCDVAAFGMRLRRRPPAVLRYASVHSAVIRAEAPTPLQLDGEIIPDALEVRVRWLQGAVMMALPPRTSAS